MLKSELLQTFGIQISLTVLFTVIIFSSILAKAILEFWKLITRKDFELKYHPMYGTLKRLFVYLSIIFVMHTLPFSEKIKTSWEEIAGIINILFIAKFLTIIVDKDSRFIKKTIATSKSETVNLFICKIVRGLIWIISAFIIVKQMGYNLTGLAAGLGVGSIVISLAAQDTVKSILSGVVIFTDKPFEIGDWVEIGQFQGTVHDISFRSTRIRSYDNSIISIPNSVVTTEYIINWNRLKSRRFDCVLNLEKGCSTEKIKKVISQVKLVLKSHPKVKSDTVEVYLDQIASYSDDIKIYLYVNEVSYIKFSKIKEELYCRLLEVLDKENIELAYPTQTIKIKESPVK